MKDKTRQALIEGLNSQTLVNLRREIEFAANFYSLAGGAHSVKAMFSTGTNAERMVEVRDAYHEIVKSPLYGEAFKELMARDEPHLDMLRWEQSQDLKSCALSSLAIREDALTRDDVIVFLASRPQTNKTHNLLNEENTAAIMKKFNVTGCFVDNKGPDKVFAREFTKRNYLWLRKPRNRVA